MRGKRLSTGLRSTLAIFTVTLLVVSTWAAPKEKVLHNFNGKDGYYPYASLIFDANGNLYGTTPQGGAHSGGTVFELTSKAGGGWTEKILHNFNPNGKDGVSPYASLIFDAAGNLYGTTAGGGAHSMGVVFELKPKAGGSWTENVLHSFDGKDGYYPFASLIFDVAGNLYGTTSLGGISSCNNGNGCGTVFELTPKSGGGWTEKVLHEFGKGTDGNTPYAGLIFDVAGNLYGTTAYGGAHGVGTTFELEPKTGGGWTEKVLLSFNDNATGTYPFAGLIFDAGVLYGATFEGGTNGVGAVFELAPKSGGGWTETLAYSFNNNATDGSYPGTGSLIQDASGDLYGTTYHGGAHSLGAAFELTPKAGGGWTEKVLHSFGSGKDGQNPQAGLIPDSDGNVYGTTFYGGSSVSCTGGCGTVFEITP